MKRVAAYLSVLLLLGTLPMTSFAAAAADDAGLTIDQVSVNKPEVTVYFTPPSGTGEEFEVQARLGGEDLSPVSASPFAGSGEGVWYIFAVDISTSMTPGQISGIRSAIADVADNMGANDRVTLIAFGKELEIPVNLSGDAAQIKEAADALRANQNGTLFYDAIVKALELGSQYDDSIPVRRAAFVFSDAEDYNVGGYVDREVESKLASSDMAMYAFGFLNATRSDLDNFGAMARLSNGGIDVVTAANVQEAVASRVQSIRSGYIASFASQTNIVSGNSEKLTLTVTAGAQTYRAQRDVTPSRHIPDNTPPAIVSAGQTGQGTISIVFSEPVNGANGVHNYRLEDAAGDLLALKAVSYDETGLTASLSLADIPHSGNITITFPGITDISMEKNTIAEPATVSFAAPPPEPTPTPAPLPPPIEDPPQESDLAVWLFGSLIIAVIVAGVILGVIKSRGGLVRDGSGKLHFAGKQEVVEVIDDSDAVQYKFVTAKAPEIRLRVIDGSGRSKDISVPVAGSAFVGRAEGNDLVFDDTRMSRQHFAFVSEQGGFQIMNLSETAGTLLNGVPLGSQRPLNSGDKIEAGSITFVVL